MRYLTEKRWVNDITTNPRVYDISSKLDDFQEKQESFNKQLLNMLHEQQKYIYKLLENQDKNMKRAKHLVSPDKQNKDFFNQIMAEHKVKK